MAEIYFEAKGIQEVKELLKGLTPRLKAKVLKKAFEKAADPLIAEIKSNIPVAETSYRSKRTGKWIHRSTPFKRYSNGTVVASYMPENLKKSIGKMWPKGNKSYLRVGAKAGMGRKFDGYYAHMVERGTKYTSAQPFMRPAFDKMQGQIRKSIAGDVILAVRKWRDR